MNNSVADDEKITCFLNETFQNTIRQKIYEDDNVFELAKDESHRSSLTGSLDHKKTAFHIPLPGTKHIR